MEIAIVGGLLNSTLTTLFSVIRDKCKKVEPDVQSIQNELEFIQATIEGSRWRGNETSDIRRTWIAQLRRLADDIEDCMDSFEVKATSASKFAEEIAEIKKRITESSERLKHYIGQQTSSNEQVHPVMDRYNAEDDLLSLLGSQSEMKAKVISAISLGGQKTALARRVYDKDEVQRQFGQRAWVSAVDKESVYDVLTDILGQLDNEPCHGLGMFIRIWVTWLLSIFPLFHGLLLKPLRTKMPGPSPSRGGGSDVEHQLEARLNEKRYLIVIDDVRTEEMYNEICAFAWASRVGGRIIVTADIQPAVRACMCGNDLPLVLPDISTATAGGGLVLVGETGEMFYEETCLALCAAAVARTQRLLVSEYERVVLEDCLLYFSMFPRDHDVRRNPLIRRWLAEGILVHAKQRVPDYIYRFDQEILAKHLDILIRHNIIKSIKKSSNGKVKTCQPPGMVFNHICGKAVIENFITLLCGPSQGQTAQGHVRRLSLHPYVAAENGGLNMPNAPRLRTMVVFPTAGAQYGDIFRIENHRLLRVLDLKECADVTAGHVEEICKVLLLLKYLSLGNGIERVPRTVSGLQRLETLEMRTTVVVTVYSELLKLPKLKHLLGRFRLSTHDCPDENPSVLKKGAKKVLRLKDEFSKLKDFLRKSSVLETLAGIVVGNGIGLPQLLSCMLLLRKVKIWCDSTTVGSTDLTALKDGIKVFTSHGTRMTTVDYSMSIDFNGSSQSFLDCLEDHGRLASLKLSDNLPLSIPVNIWLVSVQELCLSWTNLRGDFILAGLSNLRCQLKFLKLVENNLVGLSIQNDGPFVGLQRICLVGMQSLVEITIQDLIKLDSLHLLCQTLGALPGVQIGSLRNLKEIGLHSGVDGDIKHAWEDAAMDHQRQPNVVSIETH